VTAAVARVLAGGVGVRLTVGAAGVQDGGAIAGGGAGVAGGLRLTQRPGRPALSRV
jgi:hypothetical protein